MCLGDQELGLFFIALQLVQIAESLRQSNLKVVLIRAALLR